MSRSTFRRAPLACALALALCSGSCATNHVLNWGKGDPSIYHQNPDRLQSAFLQPAGTVVALPAAIVWDVATFPFQWLWGIYPYGGEISPEQSVVR